MLGNPATGTLAQLPTDERLKRYAQGNAGGVPADERSGSVLRRLSGRRAGRSARNGPVDIPRNIFIAETGKKEAVSVASTMNMGIIWDLFSNVDAAARQLNVDADFRKMLGEKKQKLFPLQIGKAGNLQEWYHDWTDEDPEHRHVSHLFVLHPGREVSPLTTPNYADAARKTLAIRGDGGTGWSKAWKINFWARLHDGNHAYKLLRELLKLTGVEGTEYAKGGGTYPNLLCAHPPFQIDGNFGGISGMSEMPLQSHDGLLNCSPPDPMRGRRGRYAGLKRGVATRSTWTGKTAGSRDWL